MMFTINAYNNPYLRVGQTTLQAVLSLSLDRNVALGPAPLSLAVAMDRSASMDGPKMRAAREGAVKVVQAIDESMIFMVVAFNDNARVLFGPATGTAENKRKAITALQAVTSANGTRMSLALNAIVDKLGPDQTRAKKVLFLTDGKNEGELRVALDRAVDRCTAANISINAWGVGTDWDAAELRHIADATHGSADIIPTPDQVATAFASSFNEMRKTAIANARLALWTPVGVKIQSIAQVFPSIVQQRIGTNANADESRWLIALEFKNTDKADGIQHWQSDWDSNTNDASNPNSVKSLPAQAQANRTWPEEDQPLADMQTNWNTYFSIDSQIRSAANSGDLQLAGTISTGLSNDAFGKFIDAVDQLKKANYDHYYATLNTTQSILNVYIFLSAIIFPLIGLAAVWGVSQRFKDL